MDGALQHPTLLVGLGRFGREVAALLQRQRGGEPASPVVLLADTGGQPADGLGASSGDLVPSGPAPGLRADEGGGEPRLVDEALAAARRLLDLRHRVETTSRGDSRPPRLDVFVIADLSEAGAAEAVPSLASQLGVRLREAFRPIFAGTGGRLTVCPVLSMPRAVRGRPEVAAAIGRLDDLSRDEDERRRPLAPIYLVEDQTARYVLGPEEVVRTVASWLHLVLYSGLRDHEEALKASIEQDGDGQAPFASFACATLEFDTRPLVRYCTGRLALEIIDALLDDRDDLGALDATAQRLAPEGSELRRRLAVGRNERDIGEELTLERGALALGDPSWRDSPETVTALVEPYVARVLASGENQRHRIEDFKMESAARLVDEGGLAILKSTEAELEKEITRCLRESASGLESARARLVALEGRIGRLAREARDAIDRPALPELPDGKELRAAHQAVLEEVAQRPRWGRMLLWGVLSAVLMAVFTTAIIRLFWRISATVQIPFTQPDVEPPGGGRFIAGYPWAAIWAGLVCFGSQGWILYRKYQSCHRRLLERFEGLRRTAARHFEALERYYAERVRYSQALWASRLETHLHERVQGERALLETARTALQRARERIADEVYAAAEADAGADGLLFRGLLTGEDLRTVYETRARPRDPGVLALAYLGEMALDGPGWRSGRFVERDALLGFAGRVCPDLSTLQPFSDDAAWAGAARARAAGFLGQLAGKLSLPIELGVDGRAGADEHVSYVPAESRAEVDRLLGAEGVARRWSVRECADPRRMHLFIATRGIRRENLKLLDAEPGSGVGR